MSKNERYIVGLDIGTTKVCAVVASEDPVNGHVDIIGAGIAWAELFSGGTNQETAFELFYKLNLTDRVSLQPDLQYIVTPFGIHRDAIAVGLRFQVGLW